MTDNASSDLGLAFQMCRFFRIPLCSSETSAWGMCCQQCPETDRNKHNRRAFLDREGPRSRRMGGRGGRLCVSAHFPHPLSPSLVPRFLCYRRAFFGLFPCGLYCQSSFAINSPVFPSVCPLAGLSFQKWTPLGGKQKSGLSFSCPESN